MIQPVQHLHNLHGIEGTSSDSLVISSIMQKWLCSPRWQIVHILAWEVRFGNAPDWWLRRIALLISFQRIIRPTWYETKHGTVHRTRLPGRITLHDLECTYRTSVQERRTTNIPLILRSRCFNVWEFQRVLDRPRRRKPR